MRHGIKLGLVQGVPVYMHFSWGISIGALLISLVLIYFPLRHPEWSWPVLWASAVVAAGLFTVSVLGHEIGHTLVARSLGLRVSVITLVLFGGATQLRRDPDRPVDELLTGVAGPAASSLIAAGFAGLWVLTVRRLPVVAETAGYLAAINALLVVFNLLPGLPFDGGHVLHASIWAITGRPEAGFKMMYGVGCAFGFVVILVGFLVALSGGLMTGLWIALAGVLVAYSTVSSGWHAPMSDDGDGGSPPGP